MTTPTHGASLEVMITHARKYWELGMRHHADVYYRLILRDTAPPTSGVARVAHAEACVWYAKEALAKNRLGTAADWYREAIMIDPRSDDYRIQLALGVLLPMGAHNDARIEAERATQIVPTNPEAWRALGIIEHESGNAAACIQAYGRQLELIPDSIDAQMDRAHIALDVADYATVQLLCHKIIAKGEHGEQGMHTDTGSAWILLAMVEHRTGNHEQAIELFDKGIAEGYPHVATARWNKSLSLHSIGLYREGWAEHECRGQQDINKPLRTPMRRFTPPILDLDKHPPVHTNADGSVRPTKVHVHEEQGYGDTLALIRYVKLLLDRGYEVHLEVREPLFGLMSDSFPQIKVLCKAIDYPGALGLEAFDVHVPMLSFPAIFKTDIDTVPWYGPYLRAAPELVAKYRQHLPRDQWRIGVCWSSGIREGIWIKEYGKRKSLHLSQLIPLFNGRDLFVSLQVGPERAQINEIQREIYQAPVDLLPAGLPAWHETAALIDCLDLVITADTSVAHLAGAMGKPVWVMMHCEGSWHWMVNRTDSPWYPRVRLFRQTKPHDWNCVVYEIAKTIKATLHPQVIRSA